MATKKCTTKIYCPGCRTEHFTDEVEFVDIEEDFFGRDVMHFICPEASKVKVAIHKSNVFGER